MTRQMSDAGLQGVLELSPMRRHAWFLQRAREAGQGWPVEAVELRAQLLGGASA